MGQRVLLVIIGIAIYWVLRDYVGLPRLLAAALGFAPFALAESKGFVPGPYEKSARDVMHEENGPEDGQK